MEELQTDTLYSYEKSQTGDIEVEGNCDSEKVADTLLNGCDEDDPLDLMDHCDNESIGSNSDVWKGSDTEDEKETSSENIQEKETNNIIENKDQNTDEIKENEENKETEPKESAEKQPASETNESPPENEVLEAEATKASDSSEEKKELEPQNGKEETEIADKKTEPSKQDENQIEPLKQDENKIQPPKQDAKQIEPRKQDDEKEIHPSKLDEKEIQSLKQNEKEIESPKQAENEIEPLNRDEKLTELSSTESKEKESEEKNSVEDLPGENQVVDKDPLSSSPPPLRNDSEVDNDYQMDYDADEDDDFDPSLLCPEVSMDVDENPVVTTNCTMSNNFNGSPLPYEPLFSTFVDDVTGAEILFNLTPEEFEMRKRLYGISNPVQTTKIHCTACNVHLGSALDAQNNRFVHPLLKVLICKDCYHFYTSGEFEKDEDGSELYCRWCGQGGQVLCCSQCEFVFCKRCIRTNFGRKKMFEIRDSDCWDCFRCNPTQIMTQRVQCFEFFEYIRHEMSLTSSENNPDHWSKDYTRCCYPKKRPNEFEEIKKVKKRKESKELDPEYIPTVDSPTEMNSTLNVINAHLAKEGLTLPKPIKILPKPVQKDNDIEFVRQINPPHVTVNPRPGFRAVFPSIIRPAIQPTLLRISAQPVPPLVPTNQARILSNALQGRNKVSVKHDWFDKTVRAAARVNSHLSYTLTQLNKAQNQAGSVEELAVVHNKLQEILSSSINSLIQIRKNLRTEFISGIKTVKLPPKKTESFSNDDDVICITPPTAVLPTSSSQDPLAINTTDLEKPRGYLKVKSVKDLQNVPAECITIPDDTPPPKFNNISITLKKVNKADEDKPGTSNGADAVSVEKESEVPIKEPITVDKITKVKSKELIFVVRNQPANEIRKMMSVKVKLIREDLVELQKKLLSKKH